MILLKTPPLNFTLKAEVVAILLFVEKQVLLVQRLPNHPQANLWCPPGGKIQDGESTLNTATRELYEETGIQINEHRLIDLGKFYVRYPNGDFIFHLFKTALNKSEVECININEREHQNYCFCPIEKLHRLELTPGLDECFEIALASEQ